jgi:hypothetical protein
MMKTSTWIHTGNASETTAASTAASATAPRKKPSVNTSPAASVTAIRTHHAHAGMVRS